MFSVSRQHLNVFKVIFDMESARTSLRDIRLHCKYLMQSQRCTDYLASSSQSAIHCSTRWIQLKVQTTISTNSDTTVHYYELRNYNIYATSYSEGNLRRSVNCNVRNARDMDSRQHNQIYLKYDHNIGARYSDNYTIRFSQKLNNNCTFDYIEQWRDGRNNISIYYNIFFRVRKEINYNI